jgi:hypothetical protein
MTMKNNIKKFIAVALFLCATAIANAGYTYIYVWTGSYYFHTQTLDNGGPPEANYWNLSGGGPLDGHYSYNPGV